MFHAGATAAEAAERVAARICARADRDWSATSGLRRLLVAQLARRIAAGVWGEKHCGPGHRVAICRYREPGR
jgi:hypothetical protein